MAITFAERADQLCDKLRDLEHQAQEGDELFFCAYLLGLLGLHSNADGEGADDFDHAFHGTLLDTLEAEGMTEEDQQQILSLWQSITQ
ncbi:hypothetical protein [Marinomonas sp. THO17]|uniref:hypothetical protein n=1 Tax=Marinomonas sp. THO17 TaxID=3149048 RepID=UPI00336C20F7